MITLKEIFDNLAYGEFANLALGNSPLGTLTEDKYPKIVSAMNLGLVEIYKRFILKRKKCLLMQQTGVTTYYLRSDYVGDYLETVDDGSYEESAFNDDLIKVLEVEDAAGEDIPLNNPRYPDTGVFTQAFDTITMQPASPLKTLTLTYQAEYPKIVITDDFDPTEIRLFFPNFILEALLAYIAARVFKGKTSKSAEGETNLSTTFNYQFENACKKITELGLAEEAEELATNFTNKGFI
jgi:hypothetical protein